MRKNITVNNKSPQHAGEPPKQYSFDSVYAPDAKQLDIYNETARPIVDFVLEGYNGEFHTACKNFILHCVDFLFCDCDLLNLAELEKSPVSVSCHDK